MEQQNSFTESACIVRYSRMSIYNGYLPKAAAVEPAETVQYFVDSEINARGRMMYHRTHAVNVF